MEQKTKLSILIVLLILIIAGSVYWIGFKKNPPTPISTPTQEEQVFEERTPDDLPMSGVPGDEVGEIIVNKETISPTPFSQSDLEKLQSEREKELASTPPAENTSQSSPVAGAAPLKLQGRIGVNYDNWTAVFQDDANRQMYTIRISEKTKITINGKRISFADLQTGDTIIVEAPVLPESVQTKPWPTLFAETINIVGQLPIVESF
jgi:hypothetical protein